jgi:DNA-binding response OmpR family regulator
MNGLDLCDRIRETRAGLPVLFISGYTQDAGPIPTERAGGTVRFLKKPFTMGEFLSSVRSSLGES